MAAKVVRRPEVGGAAERLATLVGDEVARVRSAAVRALAAVGEVEESIAVRNALDDADPRVWADAERALRQMSRRLVRPM